MIFLQRHFTWWRFPSLLQFTRVYYSDRSKIENMKSANWEVRTRQPPLLYYNGDYKIYYKSWWQIKGLFIAQEKAIISYLSHGLSYKLDFWVLSSLTYYQSKDIFYSCDVIFCFQAAMYLAALTISTLLLSKVHGHGNVKECVTDLGWTLVKEDYYCVILYLLRPYSHESFWHTCHTILR